ncbi:DUF58 domain-containing protein [Sulfitobacter sp. SK012]|uniref:DUF58 domain-containing protein n=1 Tax=Sulfitobacter sp. SK012 TaxID=1389005 RepID=UPI000E0AB3A1|nr:DUF58 domain-containing protein [Sulfitobacter sp. SK012]AXI44730.1 DUF58 domain-containing protein [Sulfitobacter sp. SK012]
MQDKAARIRTGVWPASAGAKVRKDTRCHIDFEHLLSLESKAKSLTFLPRQPARSALNGRHASRLRGRGLNFEELRDYLPSDDVRSIDWKVTARTGKPYVRVFTEERDRPVLIVVDQRMSMFFGSKLNMKSVTAAECAALAAFRILDQGDRVGGIVFGDNIIAEVRPQRSRGALNRFLTALADANNLLQADAPNVDPVSINQVLHAVARIAPRNHLLIILSDFSKIDGKTRKIVSGLSKHNDVVLGLVTDPYAKDLPKGASLVVSDGSLQVAIDMGDQKTHQKLSEMASDRLVEILDWQRKTGVPVLPLSSAEDSLTQMRRLMGLRPR